MSLTLLSSNGSYTINGLEIPSWSFTGTQQGMTVQQKLAVRDLATEMSPNEVHHGDCIGADADFHHVIRLILPRTTIHGHPPRNQSKRAFCKVDVWWPEEEYIARNHTMVDHCPFLLATPDGPERIRSGTCATVRYARKFKRPICIVCPSGFTTKENY